MKLVWRKYKKKIILSTILLLLLVGFRYVYIRLPLITGYAAKDMCSCVFIGDREEGDVAKNEFQFSLIKYADYQVDKAKKSVTATVFGMKSKTAYFTPKNGCVILNDTDPKKWKHFKGEKYPVRDFPLESLISDISVTPKGTKLNQAIRRHFKDANPEKPFGTRAVVVLKNGKLIAEHYAKGYDENSKHIGWSMTKSIFNALIGIAIQQEKLEGVDQRSLFPTWKDERKNISLKDLLRMNSGLSWDEDYSTVSEATSMLYDQDNMVDFVKKQGMEAKIGEHWEYSSGTSNLLGGILRDKMTDQEYIEFPYKYLFDKIGAPSFILETDASNNFVASSYAWATARDWAKFGQLFLDKGVVGDEQILPFNWIEFTTEKATDSKGTYGAQFWLPTKKKYPNSPKDMYFADGFQGQRVFIIPSEGLVIVRMGLSRFEHPNYDKLIVDVIEALKE